jgi:hypothetical protein
LGILGGDLLNRKEAIIVAAILSITFVGAVFADTPSTPSRTATAQTTGEDIILYENIPAAMEIWNIPSQLSIPKVNFTTAFSFAPNIGFVRVTSVALAISCSFSTTTGVRPANMGIIVEINGQSSGTMALPVFGAVATASGFLSVQGLRPGANVINIVLPANDVLTLYKAQLTVEYTFLP